MLVDNLEHLLRLKGLEPRPTQVLVRPPAFAILTPLREDATLQRLLQHRRLALLDRLQLVEPLDEQQIGDLLHDAERILQAARPEVVPDAVDLIFDFANDHFGVPPSDFRCDSKRSRGRIQLRIIGPARLAAARVAPLFAWRSGARMEFEVKDALEALLERPVDLVDHKAIEASRDYIRRRRILAGAEAVCAA